MESELAVPVIPLSQVGGGNGARYLAVGPIPSLQVAAGQQGHCMVPVGGQRMVGGPSLCVGNPLVTTSNFHTIPQAAGGTGACSGRRSPRKIVKSDPSQCCDGRYAA